MATLHGAAVASPPKIQATNTPPAEGQAARVVSDILPPKAASSSASPAPGQHQQFQSPRPSQSQSPQSAVSGFGASKGMAAHHRILALNRAWEEKREKGRRGGLGAKDSDSSETDSESDGGDIIIPPRKNILEPLRPQAAPPAQAGELPFSPEFDAGGYTPYRGIANSEAAPAAPLTPTTHSPLIGQPLKLPASVPANPVIPSSSNKTPVPLPEYLKKPLSDFSKPEQKTGHPSITTRADVAHKQPPTNVLRARARHFSEKAVLKRLSQVAGGSGTPPQQKSTGQAPARASAGIPPLKTTAGGPPTKGSPGPLLSPTSEMHFATGGELLARIRQGASPSQTTPASALPPSASAPAQLPNVDHGEGDGESDWTGSDPSESDDTDDDEDLMMLEETPPGFLNKQATKPLSIQPPTKDKNGGLENTVDGRPYGMLYHSGSDGPPEGGRGTIIPENYKLHDPPLRYICPVRDCRRLLKNMTALGGHFTAAHKGAKFNDNRDGTLTLVDTYKNLVGYSPGIVISQNPLPPNAPPPAEPSAPPWNNSLKRGGNPFEPLQGRRTPRYVIGASGIAVTPTHTSSPALKKTEVPLPDAPRSVQGTDDVIKYLHSFLAKTHTIPYRPDISFMQSLPRLRNLPTSWIKQHRGSHLPVGFYASALAYLTGDEITGAGACTQNMSHLSDVCIALPSSLPKYARKEFTKLSTCVGCLYCSHLRRQRNSCDWANNRWSSSGSVEQDKATSPAVVPSNASTPATASTREATPSTNAIVRPRTLASMREPRNKRPAPALPFGVSPAPKVAKVSAVSTGQREDADLDEMEPWEFAPGRMTDDTGSENVAFSGAYLTNSQPVLVFQDVSINIIVVKPGGSNPWAVETDKLRTCTVAAGKIKVKVAEKTFQVGPNGAFVIQPGQTCLVENKCYFDATIHCHVVKDYELS
ncbi:hypothetical protein TOPH_03317 [Tolypocladium ophioglossoides CBS 100239]|uniref:C2H2-type domain-containing protein n=1 Tax=Tolypocladium ophioglossoides (strain CBS 100239) TaxID=1163406 RepID=A0A0L0ND01_TOLOC|nr:hypothetical protein TOPH_03317 [Tolypocladium ophioglossoides CBS 100239]